MIRVYTVNDDDNYDDDDDTVMILIIGCACGALFVISFFIIILCCCKVQGCLFYPCCHALRPSNITINTADGLDTDTLLDKPTRSNICCNCC